MNTIWNAESYCQFCESHESRLSIFDGSPNLEDIPELSHGRVIRENIHSVYVVEGV